MKFSRDIRSTIGLCVLATAFAVAPCGMGPVRAAEPTKTAFHVRMRVVPGDAQRVDLIVDSQSQELRYRVKWNDGRTDTLTPDDYSKLLFRDQNTRGWTYRLLNITSPIGILWVGLGMLGQVLFTGRMIVQWLVSEKERRSVVPVAFWWMSIGGATMLIVYFSWRQDIVGVLGQATGWLIYVRNLVLIYLPRKPRDNEGGAESATGDVAAASD